jgi:hypothetical protein
MELTDSVIANIIQSIAYDAPSKVKLMIHHQFPDIELVSPLYYGNGATCYLSPKQIVNAGFTMQTGFNINSGQKESIGVLMYKLKKDDIDQLNEETTSSEDETTCTQLFIAWKIDSYKEFWVALDIIKHDKSRVWNRDGLMELAGRCRLFNVYSPVERTWLIHDNKALVINLNVTREEKCCRLEMIIYEGCINKDTQIPWYIDMVR